MAGIVPNEGEAVSLENTFKNASPEAFLLKLFSNAATLANSNTSASFTECAISGYAAASVSRASFGAAVAGSPSYIQCSSGQTFSFTGSGTVYGYYLVGATSGKVYIAETMYAAGKAVNSGDSITVTPKIYYGSATND